MRYSQMRFIFIMTLVSIGCRNTGTTTQTTVFITPSDTSIARETDSTAGKYQLKGLTPKMNSYLADRLQDARRLVREYLPGTKDSPFDARVLDEVLDKWRATGEKEKPDSVVEALGFAFGQGLADSLHLEWQIWSDTAGEDPVVIDRKFMVYAYPLATASRAYMDNKVGSFRGARTVLIESLKKAKTSGDVQERY